MERTAPLATALLAVRAARAKLWATMAGHAPQAERVVPACQEALAPRASPVRAERGSERSRPPALQIATVELEPTAPTLRAAAAAAAAPRPQPCTAPEAEAGPQ